MLERDVPPDNAEPERPDEPAGGGLTEFVNASLLGVESSDDHQGRSPSGAHVAMATIGLGCRIPITLLGIVGAWAIAEGTLDLGALALSTMLIVGIPLLILGVVGMASLGRFGRTPPE